jgi:hypothetical protein
MDALRKNTGIQAVSIDGNKMRLYGRRREEGKEAGKGKTSY